MKYVLVKSRHDHYIINSLPALFDTINGDQIFDFDYHKKIIHESLKDFDTTKYKLKLYVTGMTPLLISVLNYCALFKIPVLLYHYDLSSGKYVRQSVI